MKQAFDFNNTFNRELSPSFNFGYTGPGTGDFSERLRARQEFDAAEAEKAFAVLCGEILEQEYGSEIFCGKLPEGVRNGSAVRLLAGDPGLENDYLEGKISFFSRDRSREKVLRNCSCLLVTLPLLKWLTIDSLLQKKPVTICSMSLAEAPVEKEVNGAGLGVTGVELIFDFKVCITPPAAEFI